MLAVSAAHDFLALMKRLIGFAVILLVNVFGVLGHALTFLPQFGQ